VLGPDQLDALERHMMDALQARLQQVIAATFPELGGEAPGERLRSIVHRGVVLGYDLERRRVRWEIAAQPSAPQAKAGTAEVAARAFVGESGPGMTAIAVLAGAQAKSVLVQR
jgi:hypothetical protein